MQEFQKYQLVLDASLNIISAEEKFYSYIGKRELKTLEDIIPPQDIINLKNAIFAIGEGSNTLSCFRVRTSYDKLNWIAANITKRKDGTHNVYMELSDIQGLKSSEDANNLDPMTGLLNKKAITEMAVEYTQKPDFHFYFALLDIDHFKRVNDTYGHKRGDEVIIEVAHLIRDCIGSNGIVGRIGGDEFMIILDKINQRPRLREIMNELKDTVEEHFSRPENELHLTVSVGVTLYPDYSLDYNELFMLTDKMLYRAKEKGRNRYVIYTPEIHAYMRGGADSEKLVQQHVYTEKEKNRLIMDMMERFLISDEMNVDVAIANVLLAYNLDEIHIFFDGNEESHYGVRRKTSSDDDQYKTEICFLNVPLLREKDVFAEMLNENNYVLFASDTYEEMKPSPAKTIMMDNNFRVLFIYRMTESRTPGYVMYCTNQSNILRPSEADISDFLYFAHMVELVLKTR